MSRAHQSPRTFHIEEAVGPAEALDQIDSVRVRMTNGAADQDDAVNLRRAVHLLRDKVDPGSGMPPAVLRSHFDRIEEISERLVAGDVDARDVRQLEWVEHALRQRIQTPEGAPSGPRSATGPVGGALGRIQEVTATMRSMPNPRRDGKALLSALRRLERAVREGGYKRSTRRNVGRRIEALRMIVERCENGLHDDDIDRVDRITTEVGYTLGVDAELTTDRESGEDVDHWTPVRDAVLPPGGIDSPPNAEMAGSLHRIPLGDVLQTVVPGQQSGRVAVFCPNRLGAVDFEQGRIVHASILGDDWSAKELMAARGLDEPDEAVRQSLATELITDRLCRIGAWYEAYFAVLFGAIEQAASDERVSIEVPRAALEIARRTDELPRIKRRVGGLERVWTQSGDLPEPHIDMDAGRLWAAFDGTKTLEEAARETGVLDFDALAAANTLHSEGVIEAVGDGYQRRSHPSAQRVSRTLLNWGLRARSRAPQSA